MTTSSPTDTPDQAVPETHGNATLLILLTPLAVACTLIGLTVTGALDQTAALISAGQLVTVGLPIARTIHDAAAAVTVGLLVVAAFALPARKQDHALLSSVQHRAVRWAALAGSVWFLAAVISIVLNGANTIGAPIGSPVFVRVFPEFAFRLEAGQVYVVSAAAILTATIIAWFTTRVTAIAFAAAAALFALLPLALSGHAAGALEHANAVNSLAIHLVAVSVWAGGLVAVLLLRTHTRRATGRMVARYSTLAGWAFAAVAFSGIVNATLRLTGPADLLTTSYGWLITLKAVILVLLGVAGVMQRRRFVPGLLRAPLDRGAFTRFAVAETVFMAIAIGISVAVSRSQPPIPQTPAAGADSRDGLLGFTFPPPQTLQSFLTIWHWDWVWTAAAIVGIGWYLLAVRKLHKRGDRWPVGRTIAWVVGCGIFIWTMNGGPAVYGMVHFSSHMIQHMLLMMFVPLPLVLGGPVLLALRTLPVRNDGSRGTREWLLLLVHSRWLQFLAKPAVAGTIFAGSLVAFYLTPAFQASLQSHQWHIAMVIHFLLSGYLFFWVFVGLDPGPKRPPYPILIIALLATLAFHAFFGVAVMSAETVYALDWFRALGQTDTTQLLADQRTGGGIAWGAGELPMVFVALLVVRNWIAADRRDAKRSDRKADRDGDQELTAYNEQLQALARRRHPDG